MQLSPHYANIKEQYTTWLSTLGYGNSVIYNYPLCIKYFFYWLEQNNCRHINKLTEKHIYSYITYLQCRPNKRRKESPTVGITHLNRCFTAIDKLVGFLYQNGLHTAPVPLKFRLKQDRQELIDKIEPFTVDEIKILMVAIPDTYTHLSFKGKERMQEQLKLIFALYYGCGLRRNEGYQLTPGDIDFERKTIFVKQGKNYKDRVVPMNEGIYKVLQNYMYNFRNSYKLTHSRLFINTTFTLNYSLTHLQKLTPHKAIQSKKITLHILRHSIATHLLQNGMSIENIARFLGHNSIGVTQMYTHIINNK